MEEMETEKSCGRPGRVASIGRSEPAPQSMSIDNTSIPFPCAELRYLSFPPLITGGNVKKHVANRSHTYVLRVRESEKRHLATMKPLFTISTRLGD